MCSLLKLLVLDYIKFVCIFIFLCDYFKYLLLFSTAEVMQRLLEQKNKALGTGGAGAAIMPPAQST